MKDHVRMNPYVEAARCKPLRNIRGIEERANDAQCTLCVVVWKPGLLVKLLEVKELDSMNDRCKS